MAEARSISELRSNISERGVRLLSDEDGYHFSLSVTIPPKEVVAHIMRGRLRRGVNFVVNGMYPLSHLFAIVFSAGLVVVVLLADEESWVRSGPIAAFVWRIAPYLDWTYFPTLRGALAGLGLERWDVSRHVRIGVLAWWTGVVFCLLLATLQRYWLRALLSWQGWLSGRPKGALAKARVTLWGACVKLSAGRRPLLYSFQGCLPRLPVPDLGATVERYLASVRPLYLENLPRPQARKKIIHLQ